MAQRYGRKRKRAHLARIGALEHEVQFQHSCAEVALSQARHARSDLHRLKSLVEDWDSDIRRVLGEYTALGLTTPELAVRDVNAIRYMQNDAMRLNPMAHPFGPHDIETLTSSVHRLVHLIVNLSEPDAITLRRYMRMKLTDHEDYRYAFSEELWRDFHLGRIDQRLLIEEIGRGMLALERKRQVRVA